MKRIAFYIAFFALLVAAFCIGASAQIYEGRALDEAYIHNNSHASEGYRETIELAAYYDVQYHFDTETGVLRIFCGETNPQKMLPYADGDWVPWTKYYLRPYIKTVIIEEGILSVGMFSFYQCENLETVYLPSSLLRVDQTSFYECPKLSKIYYAGNESDFRKYVEFQDKRNSYTGGAVERKAIDLVSFGESVTVHCKNQDGEIFRSYKVGGFSVGDTFHIVPPEIKGLSYVGKKAEINGVFALADAREYVLEYICAHEYEQKEELQYCSQFCIYCGCCDPAFEDEHTWVVKKDVARGLFRDGVLKKHCAVCGLDRQQKEFAYIWTIGFCASILVFATAIFCAIFFPVRKKVRIKRLTW